MLLDMDHHQHLEMKIYLKFLLKDGLVLISKEIMLHKLLMSFIKKNVLKIILNFLHYLKN